jgi:hypothetical protein
VFVNALPLKENPPGFLLFPFFKPALVFNLWPPLDNQHQQISPT